VVRIMTPADALHQADVKLRAGQLREAETIVRGILQANPNEAHAWDLLGLIAEQTRNFEPAMHCFASAVKLRPDLYLYRFHLANMYRALGRMEEAIAEYEKVAAAMPELSDVRINLGVSLANAGRTDEAIANWKAVVEREPRAAECLANLGNMYRIMGRISDSIEYSKRALEIQPDAAQMWSNLGVAYEQQGRLADAIVAYRKALELHPLPGAHSNWLMALAYSGSASPKEAFDAHVAFDQRFTRPIADREIRPHSNDRNPDRKLRIGYVSPDLREHAMAFFMEPVLANHAREQFDVFCYHSIARPDAITQRLQSYPATWRSLVGVRNEAAAQMIRDDRIDILVDLSTHTVGNRLLLFARKPAPIQVTWLGYASTTGLSTIDYRISDGIVDPPGLTDAFHSEKLVRLPRTQWCYRPPEQAPEIAAPPHEKNGYITFGNPTNLAKVTPQVLDMWSAVLRAVPNSHLSVKATSLADAPTQQLLRDAFSARGIAAERIHLEPSGNLQQYLGFFNTIDVCLDTFPFTGGTTTCHTLWMGVPVVTLIGETSVSRVGASVLTNVGLADLIADSPERFVEIATRLAADRERLRTLRRELRQMMKTSPLCDGPAFVRDLEAAYRAMWHAWAT
jgi:predicted O-linked N-acetylglucosamine transferase (SPINDLY family)